MTITASTTEIDLTWTNPSGETLVDSHVYLYSNGSCSGVTTIQDIGAAATGYSYTGLAPNTLYSFAVTASNSTGESPLSGCASAMTFGVPPAPTDLVAMANGPTEIDLTWVNPVGPLTDNYVYFQATGGCGALSSIDLSSVVTSYALTGLAPSTEYSFEVTAWNITGESVGSNCAAATTPANVIPSLVISNVQSFYATTFDESWSNGTWTNVTSAYLIVTNDSVSCNDAALTSYWTWAVYTEGGYIPSSTTVSYDYNATDSLNYTFSLGQTVWVGLYVFYPAGPSVFSCQNVTFTFTPPPPIAAPIAPWAIIALGVGLSLSMVYFAVYWARKKVKWDGWTK